MKKQSRNFHVPLPDDLYGRLKEESRRREVPATQMVREAIEVWLDEAEREALHRDISAYAREMAGTEADLDETLEAAGLEHLDDEEGSE
jgi:predicted DNA-binding protein